MHSCGSFKDCGDQQQGLHTSLQQGLLHRQLGLLRSQQPLYKSWGLCSQPCPACAHPMVLIFQAGGQLCCDPSVPAVWCSLQVPTQIACAKKQQQ